MKWIVFTIAIALTSCSGYERLDNSDHADGGSFSDCCVSSVPDGGSDSIGNDSASSDVDDGSHFFTDSDSDSDSNHDTGSHVDTETEIDTETAEDTETEIDTDTDTETETEDSVPQWCQTLPSGNVLCWEAEPQNPERQLNGAFEYCESLGGDWQLPQVQDLIALLGGCISQYCKLQHPGWIGPVHIDDDCAQHCDLFDGPGVGGCYSRHPRECERGMYVSASPAYNVPRGTWAVGFAVGSIEERQPTNYNFVLCVRYE